jgi:hypothetical protein
MTDVMKTFSEFFNAESGPLKRVTTGFQDFFMKLADLAGPAIAWVGKSIGKALTGLADLISGKKSIGNISTSGPMNFISKLIKPIAAGIATAWPFIKEGFSKLVDVLSVEIPKFLDNNPKIGETARKAVIGMATLFFGPAVMNILGTFAVSAITSSILGSATKALVGGLTESAVSAIGIAKVGLYGAAAAAAVGIGYGIGKIYNHVTGISDAQNEKRKKQLSAEAKAMQDAYAKRKGFASAADAIAQHAAKNKAAAAPSQLVKPESNVDANNFGTTLSEISKQVTLAQTEIPLIKKKAEQLSKMMESGVLDSVKSITMSANKIGEELSKANSYAIPTFSFGTGLKTLNDETIKAMASAKLLNSSAPKLVALIGPGLHTSISSIFSSLNVINAIIKSETEGKTFEVPEFDFGSSFDSLTKQVSLSQKAVAKISSLGPALARSIKTGGVKTALDSIKEVVALVQQLDNALSTTPTLDVASKLGNFVSSSGLGSKAQYTVKAKDVVINLNLNITMDVDKVEKVMIMRQESIIRDRLNFATGPQAGSQASQQIPESFTDRVPKITKR